MSSNNKSVEARCYNVTDGTVVGVSTVTYPFSTSGNSPVGGPAEVTFAGAAKTFKIQYRSPDGSTTVGIQQARIEIWRIS